eukprot:747562-Amorphochlora_amoeboformis.AAC.1
MTLAAGIGAASCSPFGPGCRGLDDFVDDSLAKGFGADVAIQVCLDGGECKGSDVHVSCDVDE